MLRSLIAMAMLAGIAELGWGQNPATEIDTRDPVKPELVLPWIAQLGSPKYQERELAQKALDRIGDRALPQLKLALRESKSAEVQARLERLIGRYEEQRMHGPTLVTIKAKDKPLSEIFQDLQLQTGYRFSDTKEFKQPITLNLNQVPFWQAMHELSKQCSMTYYPQDNGDEQSIIYVNLTDVLPDRYICHVDSFSITASSIQSSIYQQLSGLPKTGGQNRSEYLSLSFNLHSEPKLAILSVGNAKLSKAIDDLGRSMLMPDEQYGRDSYYNSQYRTLSTSFSISMNRAGGAAKSIKEIEGIVPLVLLSGMKPEITISQLTSKKNFKVVGNTISLECNQITFGEKSVTMKIVFRQKKLDERNYQWVNTLFQKIILIDDKGEKWIGNPIDSSYDAPGQFSATINFVPTEPEKAGKPSQLMMMEWISVQRSVKFRFTDINLP